MENENKEEIKETVDEKPINEPVSENKQENKEDLTLTQTIILEKNAPVEVTKENIPEGSSFVNEIEKRRGAVEKEFKANRRISNISMVVVLSFLIACFILILQSSQACKIAGGALGGVAVVSLILSYVLTKTKFPNHTREYIHDVTLLMNQHIFNNQSYTEVFYHQNEKENKADIMAERVYKDVVEVGSRNIVKGLFNKQSFKVSEIAAYHKDEKNKQELSFLGRYISCPNTLHFDGRIIISIQNIEKPVDAPTDIQDLTKTEINSSAFVYTEESSSEYEKILGRGFITGLNSFQLNKYLLGATFVIWGGCCSAYLSYEDSVIAIPFDKPFVDEPMQQGIDDLRKTLELFALIRK